jgi:hypothetical protein
MYQSIVGRICAQLAIPVALKQCKEDADPSRLCMLTMVLGHMHQTLLL